MVTLMGKAYGASGFLSAIPGVGSATDSMARAINPLAAAAFPENINVPKAPVVPPPPAPVVMPLPDEGDALQKRRRQQAAVRTLEGGSESTILTGNRLGG